MMQEMDRVGVGEEQYLLRDLPDKCSQAAPAAMSDHGLA